MTHAERAAMGCTAGDQERVGQALTPADPGASDRRPRISTWQQCLALLLIPAGIDGRERGEYEAKTWLRLLSGYVIEDVENAIYEHYRRSIFPVLPANVIQIIEEGA